MITFLTTRTHTYTHRTVDKVRPDFRRMSYPALLARKKLPRGTYIFSDFDRLGFFELEMAAHVYRVLKSAGCGVLNDPARVLHRLTLLQKLHRLGINSFKAWPATDLDQVDRFPVFIRTASAHRGVLTDLIEDPASLAVALEALIVRGYPLVDLMIVEYRAEPIRGDVFRKMSAYRIGNNIVPTVSVHERGWTAKEGEDGVAGDEGYAEDLAMIKSHPFKSQLEAAFAASGAEYGRVDYGIVEGRPEIYEINTNPMTPGRSRGTYASLRAEAIEAAIKLYHQALDDLPDTAPGPKICIPRAPTLITKHAHKRIFPGYQWTP